jgi:hypothetical protein
MMKKIIQFIKARLAERSTLLLIGSGITTAAMLEWPWSGLSLFIHTSAALVPDKPLGEKE